MFTSSQRNTELKDLPDFFTLADLSFVLGISKATAYRMADQSRIPCIRLGKRIILSKSHLKQWIDAEIGFEIQSTTTEDIILGLLPSFVVMFVCVDTQGVSGFPPFLFLGARWRSLKLFEIAMDAKKEGPGEHSPGPCAIIQKTRRTGLSHILPGLPPSLYHWQFQSPLRYSIPSPV